MAKTFKNIIIDSTGVEEAAKQFISSVPEDERPAAKKVEVPDGYRINPEFIEKRTRRLQLVLKPSLYAKIDEARQAAGVSVNEYIHQVLEEHFNK